MQQQIQNEVNSWAQSASKNQLIEKRNRLDLLRRHSLYGNEADLKEAIKVLDDEMSNRSYLQLHVGSLAS